MISSEDKDLVFCKTVALTLRRQNRRQKAFAKMKIQQLMYDIEFQQLLQQAKVELLTSQPPPQDYNNDQYCYRCICY